MYAIFCAVAAVFVVTMVPETKGRDLETIAKLFVKKRSEARIVSTVNVDVARHDKLKNDAASS